MDERARIMAVRDNGTAKMLKKSTMEEACKQFCVIAIKDGDISIHMALSSSTIPTLLTAFNKATESLARSVAGEIKEGLNT